MKIKIALAALVALYPASAMAAPTDPVNRWLCAAVTGPDGPDLMKAAPSFPLEPLKSVGPTSAYGKNYIAGLDRDQLRTFGVFQVGVGVVKSSPIRENGVRDMARRIRDWGPVKPLTSFGGAEGVEWTGKGDERVTVFRQDGTIALRWRPGSESLLKKVCGV